MESIMNKKESKELSKVKLNVRNIRSILIRGNKDDQSSNSSIERFSKKEEQKQKFGKKEKSMESPLMTSFDNIKNSVRGSDDEGGGGNIFEKLFEFLGLMLAGIIVNALPAIIEAVKNFVDMLTSFFAPIESAFNLIIGFLTGQDIGDSKYDKDRKRVDDSFAKLNKEGGLVDKMLDKVGPLKPLIKKLTGALNKGESKSGKVVLAKKGGKEGFLNKKTGKFTQKQWTSAERSEYSGDSGTSGGFSGDSPSGTFSALVPKGGLKGLTDDDWKELAYIVSGEAQRDTDDEYGVAAAVLTRVSHPSWPDNIPDVGRQKGQFEAVYTGLARYEPALAKKLKDNQGKIADALEKLNGRTDFKGTSQYGNMGASDIKFSARGNFYHYTSQVSRRDPVPPNPDQNWKKWITNNSPNNSNSSTNASGGPLDTFYQNKNKLPGKLSKKIETINQSMYEDLDDEEEVNIYIQPVNTIRTIYKYTPLPI